MRIKTLFLILICNLLSLTAQYQVEYLNRGLIAVRSGSNNFVSWRFLGTEADNVTFNLYRGSKKLNSTPLTITNYTDNGAAATAQYQVRAVVNGVEQAPSETSGVWGQNYLQIPLQIPNGGTSPDNVAYTYNANDCSVGDVDGDGIHEVFVKWDPTNSKDNSQSGYTGNVFIDCYKLNGTRLWRIDLGRNIRAGAHYTQYMVYDFDGDGKAELACKTADGTRDASGTVIGNGSVDYRNSSGYVLSGPEFLTMFNGATGKIMQTVDYVPARGTVSAWGDGYGNRVDRFLAGVAYLDGQRPSLISCRGYYTRTVVVAWDWRNGAFTRRWTFDSNVAGRQYEGQGDHSLSIADVDGDAKQEVVYGAMIIDDNGSVLYSTGNGHGDALHVSDFNPSNPGLEVFNIQERDDSEDCYLYSPSQKKVIWFKTGTAGVEGPGRGAAANITEQSAGAECWIAGGGVSGSPFSVTGQSLGIAQPSSVNFLIWWDGDLARELSNGTTIDKYGTGRLLTTSNTASNNGSKSTPNLSGDLFGDWREELMLRTSDNTALRIYTTTTPSNHKIRTLLHDPQYRVALAWQNSGYNQPPHPSFYLGDGVPLPVKQNIVTVGGPTDNPAPVVSVTAPMNLDNFIAPASITITANATDANGTVAKVDFYNGSVLLFSDATAPYAYTWTNVVGGTYAITAVATDNAGATASSAVVNVTVSSNPPPQVTITAPTANASFAVGNPVSITATATDNETVAQVQFYNGDELLYTDATTPYAYTWTAAPEGTHTIHVRATDNLGATTTASVVITIQGQPTDCNGVAGGSALRDTCGRCVGGNTGKVACTAVLEAEEVTCQVDGITEAINEGFEGEGYINVNNTTTSYAEFPVYAPNAGNVILAFRYANGTTVDRPAQISVNGTAISSTLSFPPTGAWNDWELIEVQVPLASGSNKVRLTSTTATGLANIDQIGLISPFLQVGSCNIVTLSNDQLYLHGIHVYPNPSATYFNLSLEAEADVKVYSVQGLCVESLQKVKSLSFGAKYPAGMYSVQVSTPGQTYVFKTVKK